MRSSRSDPTLLRSRRHVVGDHIAGAIPNYAGHVPGARHDDATFAQSFARAKEAGRNARTRETCDAQVMRRALERGDAAASSGSSTLVRQPYRDSRGIAYPSAGDTQHSRIPVSGEEKVHLHSGMGLTSAAHDGAGRMASLRGFGAASLGVPGYAGCVPGKAAENIFAEPWSRGGERALAAHFEANAKAPKQWSLMTEGGTMVAAQPTDGLREVPLHNPSYQHHQKGWSKCEFTGARVDPAGRLGPRDRQEAFGNGSPEMIKTKAVIHGYSGCVPGRVGESVVGERQCKTNQISDILFKKVTMRITQR